MAYLEGIQYRSSETLRQWIKKLQRIIPGSFSKNDLKPDKAKLLQLKRKVLRMGEEVFPSQKNLDVIMNTLRRDLVNELKKSDSSNVITLLIYKLNILENNIREACRFQHTWVNHPVSIVESLKVQEKYIIRLIEEIMDDIFEAYSSLRRRMRHFSFSERNINGIINVLGILKREVCNMINIIVTCIEQRHRTTFYEAICAPPNAIEHKKIELKMSTNPFYAREAIGDNTRSKSSQTSLPSNKSYPFLERSHGRLFSSLQNIFCGLSGSQLKENSDIFHDAEGEDVPKSSRDINVSNNAHKTNGRGDADKNYNNQNNLRFSSNSAELSYKREDGPEISKNVNTYFTYAEKNKSSLLSYNKDHCSSKNIKEKLSTFDSRKIGKMTRKQDESQTDLCEKASWFSWPSVTVVRDIKSETHLDGAPKHDRSGNNDYKHYPFGSSNEDLSDSDSDESYISCALDEFQLDTTFLDHLREKCLQEKPHKKTIEDYEERNNTDRFSCKSPKLSEIFSGPRIFKRKEGRVAEIYHSVESIPAMTNCIDELSKDQMSREMKCLDVAIGTHYGRNPKRLEDNRWDNYKSNTKKEPSNNHRTLLDSFNTLALSEDFNSHDARYTESIVSFASVATETVDGPDKSQNNPSFCNYNSLKQRQADLNRVDASPNLEDSQYSAICLALPASKIRLVNTGNEGNLLAMEVEQS